MVMKLLKKTMRCLHGLIMKVLRENEEGACLVC